MENENPYGFPDLVLYRIFSFQNGEDLKTSRLVCSKWNAVCDFYFVRKMIVCFDSERSVCKTSDGVQDVSEKRFFQSVENFSKAFNHPLQETAFNSFMLKGSSWNLEIFSDVLKAIENCAKELCLKFITLCGEGTFYRHFKFDNLIPNNLKKLYIKSNNDATKTFTEFKVDCGKLASIEVLILINCSLVKNSVASQIAIKELYLDNVMFNNSEKDTVVNEVFCFTKANQITIKCDKVRYSNIVLDLGGSANLKKLKLSRIVVTGWENCNWEIQHCVLNHVTAPFPCRSMLKVKCLTIEESDVDISYLPNTIKKLTLIRPKLTCSNTIDLKKLKCLRLSEEKIENLHLFSSLPKLVDLTLESSLKYNPTELNNYLIPPSLKRLKLTKVNIIARVLKKIALESLTLNNYSFEDVETVMKTITTEQLVIFNGYINECDNDNQSTVQLMQKFQPHVKRFAIGQFFWWEAGLFEKSSLSNFVDKKAQYYLFEGGKGIAINGDQFLKMTLP